MGQITSQKNQIPVGKGLNRITHITHAFPFLDEGQFHFGMRVPKVFKSRQIQRTVMKRFFAVESINDFYNWLHFINIILSFSNLIN